MQSLLSPSTGFGPEEIWSGIKRHRIFVTAEHVLREHNLECALGDRWADLKQGAKQVRLRSMLLLSASTLIVEKFLSAGIRHRFLKGPLLSQKIYGDPGVRHSKDLDLLVRPESLDCAIDILQSHGWELRDPGMWFKGGVYRRLAELRLRHFQLFHKQTQIGLELHWRMEAGRSCLLEEKWWKLWDPSSTQLTCEEFLYLCMHGSAHAWSRLKWLGDLAAIIDRNPDMWRTSEDDCRILGLALAASQAILLLELLFEQEPDSAAAKIVSGERRAYAAAAFSVSELGRADGTAKRRLCDIWSVTKYNAILENRYPFVDRFRNQVVFWTFHETQFVKANPAFLIAMPMARFALLFRRYIAARD